MTDADQAAGRVQAYLDVREAWAKHWDEPEQIGTPIVTQPRRGLEGPSWLLLTHADLAAVLADRTRQAERIAELEAERDGLYQQRDYAREVAQRIFGERISFWRTPGPEYLRRLGLDALPDWLADLGRFRWHVLSACLDQTACPIHPAAPDAATGDDQ